MRRLQPIIETPDEPRDDSLLWIDSSNIEKPVAKIKFVDRWTGIWGEKGEKGDPPKITASPDGTIYCENELLTEVIKNAVIQAIQISTEAASVATDAAEQADEAREGIQEDLNSRVPLSMLVLISNTEYQELIDGGTVDPNKIYFVYEEDE